MKLETLVVMGRGQGELGKAEDEDHSSMCGVIAHRPSPPTHTLNPLARTCRGRAIDKLQVLQGTLTTECLVLQVLLASVGETATQGSPRERRGPRQE